MKWYVKLLLAFGFYNSVKLGSGSKWNLAGFITCVWLLVAILAMRIREGSFEKQEQLLRRLGVFLFGGFICPRCGEAKVKIGIDLYIPCVACPGCRNLFITGTPLSVGEMWRSVWRRRP